MTLMLLHRTLTVKVLIWVFTMAGALLAKAESEAPMVDEILLKNGSRLIGSITTIRDGVLTLETKFAGTLSVDMEQVTSVNTNEPVVVLKVDESVVQDDSLQIAQGQVLLPDADQSYPLQDLMVLNPEPWELGQGYRWTGLANIALARQRGNTDTDELDYKIESVWRSKQDRYTFQGNGELDKANGEKNADNWQLIGKYDFFLKDPNYVGLLASVKQDEFRDIDLRYLIGPYLGRQLYSEPVFSLQGELGFSYVVEEYTIVKDKKYWAGNWSVDASSDYLGGDSRLYFDQNGIWNLEDTSDVVLNTTFGLSFPLLWSLEAAAEVLLEYDSGAVDDVDDLDQTYKLRIGYTW